MIGYFTEDELVSLGFASVGKNVHISKTVTVYNRENISLGSDVRIDNFCVIAPAANVKLQIGNNVHISAFCFINGLGNIIIEDFVTFAPYVRVFSSTDDYSGAKMTGATLASSYLGTHSGPVILRKHVIIGNGSTIMPNVELGEGVAVGAYSLVNRSVEPFTVVAGIPARKIKDRMRGLLDEEKKLNNGKSKS